MFFLSLSRTCVRPSHRGWARLLSILCLAVAAVIGLCASAVQAAERDVIGTVVRIQGDAFALMNQERRPLAENSPIYRLDTLDTDAGARLQVRLNDGADLTLGENAMMLVSDVLATASPEPRGPVLSLIQGAFALASPKTLGADIKTPVATIGIRGTQLWGGALDNAMDVLLLEGKIEVSNAQGSVLLDQAGQGTTIPTAGQAPTGASTWSAEKVKRAVATVTFSQ